MQREALIKARPQDANERRLRSAPILEQLSAELRAITAVPRAAAARLAEGRATDRGQTGGSERAPGPGQARSSGQAPGSGRASALAAGPVLGIYWPFRG